LAATLSVLHIIALVAAIISLTAMPMFMVCLGVLLSAAGIMKALFGAGHGVSALELLEDGSAAWLDSSGLWHPVKSLTASYVSPWLTIVRLEPAEPSLETARWLLLGPDSGCPEQLRRFRVRLSLPKSSAGRKSPDAN
jgi:hypothetical protein